MPVSISWAQWEPPHLCRKPNPACLTLKWALAQSWPILFPETQGTAFFSMLKGWGPIVPMPLMPLWGESRATKRKDDKKRELTWRTDLELLKLVSLLPRQAVFLPPMRTGQTILGRILIRNHSLAKATLNSKHNQRLPRRTSCSVES